MSKIPQGEWNAIAARYQAGDSISQIARSYGCTPPAIHYILKRNRQKPSGTTAMPNTLTAPALVSGAFAGNSAGRGAATPSPEAGSGVAARRVAPPPISLSQHAPPAALRSEKLSPEKLSPIVAHPGLVRARSPEPAASVQPPANIQPPALPPREAIAPPPAPPQSGPRDTGLPSRAGVTSAPMLPGLDDALHLRAEAAIALFRSSFDQALAEGSPDVREQLRQAANDLMRVAARTTIVLDRLNASNERSKRAHNYPRSAHTGDDFGKLG
jgi:hypothetical protein